MRRFTLLFFLLAPLLAFTAPKPRYLYTEDDVRYELYQTNGKAAYNWIFLPGGPGADSCYLKSLIDGLDLPGNVWLIDLPGNGSNLVPGYSDNYDKWMEIFPKEIANFENPVLVGQSFGGMFPLLFPELENHLKGFVILNSAPRLWIQEAMSYSKQFNLPDFSDALREFTLNPNQKTFELAIDACMPYYFPKSTLEKGRKLLSQTTFQYQPAVWWQKRAHEMNFTAKWIPQNTPTLIIGGKFDCMAPHTLFERDERFQRPNIKIILIEDGGHMPWVENPQAMKRALSDFALTIQQQAVNSR